MRKTVLIAICVLISVVHVDSVSTKRRIECKTKQLAPSCYWLHGRLSFYNGTPAFRIWKIGSKKIFGVYSGPSVKDDLDNESPVFPDNVNLKLDQLIDGMKDNKKLFGDYEVCPLTPEIPNHMQSVCIESAKNLILK